MRAVLHHGERDVRVETVPEPELREPTDAVVRVLVSCVCGSDLWPYRRPGEREGGPARIGHEFVGVVEEVGDTRLPALLTLSDVMGTGHHAAVSAGVTAGSTVAAHVLEAVGMQSSWDTSVAIARPGGTIGYVGVPAGTTEGLPLGALLGRNIGVAGGMAPARAYLPELLADVLDGTIDPGPVFDLELPLEEAPAGYAAMDERRAIKVLLRS